MTKWTHWSFYISLVTIMNRMIILRGAKNANKDDSTELAINYIDNYDPNDKRIIPAKYILMLIRR